MNCCHLSKTRRIIATTSIILISASIALAGLEDYELAPIHYSDSDATDRVAAMVEDYESGQLSFGDTGDKKFLARVLEKLGVSIYSQVLVYSRTSLQNDRIDPQHPRALYFSDNYYVGWVQGGDIEIIAVDPRLGPVFYRMAVPRNSRMKPQLYRDRNCLNCHGGSRTGGVPGLTVRSVFPDSRGFPILGAGTHRTTHSSPISERWGGWYVTGSHAGDRHMGNQIFKETDPGSVEIITDYGTGLESLSGIFDTSNYLAPTSDIVALMVLEHQVTAHNAITRAHHHTVRWIHQNAVMAKHFGDPEKVLSNTTRRLIDNEVRRLLEVMFFVDEAPLEDWGVEGNEAFQQQFLATCHKTDDGRSLRDLHLMSRLFKNRLSYMIYSPSFGHLPKAFTDAFYPKLWDALQGLGPKELFQHLPESERLRIRKILLATKGELLGFVEPTVASVEHSD